jgi:AcrR family transcriptional regulator
MTEGRTKRQRRAELTADQLLEAARLVFETKGYQAATVGAITRAAHTAHGTFYLYFRNKRDVFSRVVYQVCREMYEAGDSVWDSADPIESLRAAIRTFLDVFSRHRGLWRALIQGALDDPDLEAMWVELRRPFIERTERVLEGLQAAGAVRPLDAAVWATALSSMVEWVAFTHFVLAPPPGGDADPDRLVEGMANLWYRAMFSGADVPALGAFLV